MGIVWRTVINAVAVAVAASLSIGISYDQAEPVKSLLLTGLALGVVNAIVRPLFVLLSFPITLLTMGLFLLVINGAMLLLVSAIPFLGFHVDGWVAAILGSIVISVVSFLLSRVLPD